MNHGKHSYLMVGLLVVGAALFFSGAVGGSALFLLWPLVCMAMMFFMMRGMGMGGMTGMRGDRRDEQDPDHEGLSGPKYTAPGPLER